MDSKECTKCIHNAVCKTAESCDGYVSGCKHFANGVVISNLETTTPTNADRIRAMSDETLATQLVQVFKEGIKVLTDMDMPEELLDKFWKSFLERLKQPADMRGEEDGK